MTKQNKKHRHAFKMTRAKEKGLGTTTTTVKREQDANRTVARMKIHWERNILTILNPKFPNHPLEVDYIEAFARAGSTDRDWWRESVIPHSTEKIAEYPETGLIVLRNTLKDGVVVEHQITPCVDEVDFRLKATNATDKVSEVHWAQPCVRVHHFTGVPMEMNTERYLPKSFIFINCRLTRLPMKPWAKSARYIPGQVWVPRHVDRNDVQPRPLNPKVPSNGLIGCFSNDERWISATAWEPYQDLFQGVVCCLHSDFRIGGLQPGETKTIRGKIYIVQNDLAALLDRYFKDFPEHMECKTIVERGHLLARTI